MKKIIDGKRYDTSTAECVASWNSPHARSDFHYCEESLYRTKRGAWFTAGEGGAMSKYARSAGQNSWCGGEGLEPLTPEQARDWLEEKGFTQELEDHFGHEIEEA